MNTELYIYFFLRYRLFFLFFKNIYSTFVFIIQIYISQVSVCVQINTSSR